MTTSVVEIRYAHALADIVLAPESGMDPARVAAELRSINNLLTESADLRAVLLTPALSSSVKKAVVFRLATELNVSPVVHNFVGVVLGHGRIAELSEIVAAFERLVDERLGFVRAAVTSAATLSPAESKAIETELARLAGKQVLAQYGVDPTLIGGAVVRIGSTVYDGSIRGQLERMRHHIAGGASNSRMET